MQCSRISPHYLRHGPSTPSPYVFTVHIQMPSQLYYEMYDIISQIQLNNEAMTVPAGCSKGGKCGTCAEC